jgi:hypothetical protein
MKALRWAFMCLLLLPGFQLFAAGDCLSEYNSDLIECDKYYSSGPGGRPTPGAHAGCKADALLYYWVCVGGSIVG